MLSRIEYKCKVSNKTHINRVATHSGNSGKLQVEENLKETICLKKKYFLINSSIRKFLLIQK